jgi:hypothetical protein
VCFKVMCFVTLQAVNLVNGMIVDGLGHVSLDSGTNTNVATNVQQHANNALSQANIHQGKVSFLPLPGASITLG